MDSRHESYKELLLNQLVSKINTFVKANTDNIVSNPVLHKQLKQMTHCIYKYLGASSNVDTESILSKHNLLSIDVVLFPLVHEATANKILNEAEFEHLMSHLQYIIDSDHPESKSDEAFLTSLTSTITNRIES